VKQPSGKIITAFAVRGDLDLEGTFSNTFELEWPIGSGKIREYPEIDRLAWFSVAAARVKLLKGQRAILDRLMRDPDLAGYEEGAVEDDEPAGSQ